MPLTNRDPGEDLPRFQPWLHRFAVLTACATVFLIFAGGMVTSTGSGLSVPDWPLSYGMLMPPMVGGIFYEHGHRMVATTVGLLMTIQALWLWRAEPRPWMRKLGALAWLLVVVQGVLGGMTVLYKLPIAISVTHACTAQLFLTLTVAMAVFTSRGWIEGAPRVEVPGGLRAQRLGALLVGAIFIQLILGALMRHSGAGLSVITFPLFSSEPWPALNAYTGIHFAHRFWGVGVAAATLLTLARILTHGEAGPRLKGLAAAMGATVILQVSLGVLTVLTYKRPDVTSLHVATGATLLALTVGMTLYSRRAAPATPAPRPSRAVAPLIEEARA